MKYRKLLYILWLPLILIEWLLDMAVKIVEIFRSSFETLILAIEKFMNEPIEPTP